MKPWVAWGAFHGALAVMLGAFGAHGLKAFLSAERLATYHTGVEFHFFHALALVCFGLWQQRARPEAVCVTSQWPAYCFQVGIFLFSGSLYVLAISGQPLVGLITPLGGVSFIVGWLGFAWMAHKP